MARPNSQMYTGICSKTYKKLYRGFYLFSKTKFTKFCKFNEPKIIKFNSNKLWKKFICAMPQKIFLAYTAVLCFLFSLLEFTVWFGSFRRARMDHAVHTWVSTVKIVLNEKIGIVLRLSQMFLIC
jgi:hypothetical protein